MKTLRPILAALSLAALSGCSTATTPPADIGIGGGETAPQTHLAFTGIPKDAKIVKVSARLIVDKVAPKGLNFFAIQVNFPNRTWAHGGPQFVSGGVEQVNWGGLVNRGGGSKDYKEVDWTKDLLLIECGVGKPNTVPWKWNRNTEYILTVERGAQVTLPAGYNKEHKVTAPERTMWEWKFTMEPADGSHETFTSLLYDSAGHIGSFYLWNESGYGSTADQQHARWSLPTYRVEGGSGELAPAGFKRF